MSPWLGFMGLLPIGFLLLCRGVFRCDINELFLGFVVLFVSFMILRFFGVFSSLLHFMLPRKRAGEEGVVVEEETDNGSTSINNNSVQNVGVSLIKKQRIDSDSNSNSNVAAVATVATVATTANDIVNDAASLIMASGNSNPPDIDEDLHSRQLAVYGRETMRKLFASNVLISGMQGLGAEIGKYSYGALLLST